MAASGALVISSAAMGSPAAPPIPQGSVGAVSPVNLSGPTKPTPDGLAAVLLPLLNSKALGPGAGIAVVDPGTDLSLFDRAGSDGVTPASTTKLVTAAAAATGLGADARIATRVVTGADPASIVLVGGGDPFLMTTPSTNEPSVPPAFGKPFANLTDLAKSTAEKLKANGTTTGISLSYDTGLFTGPELAPSWPRTYVTANLVSPVVSLMLNGGKVGGAVNADPAGYAAKQFAALLKAQGIAVAGAPKNSSAPQGASEIAQVSSPPVSELLQQTLTYSDNTAAEMLAHLAGKALVGEASFSGGASAARKTLDQLGVPTPGFNLVDGSGLSRDDRIAPITLAKLLAAIASAKNDQIWAAQSATPIAGLTGTLAVQFNLPTNSNAKGIVRAKTGTLTGVTSLAGTVVDADGALLAFAIMAPHAGSNYTAEIARNNIAAALAKCGCR